MGRAREWLLYADDRRQGAVYTPAAIADGVVAEAWAGAGFGREATVCDPACGGGAFLLAAARALHGRGVPAAEIVQDGLWGADTDPLAVWATAEALSLWAWEAHGVEVRPPEDHLVVGDALFDGNLWSGRRFDLVVGNPPFQGQLLAATARSRDGAGALRSRFGAAVGGYADTAAAFLLAAAELAAPGGRVSLIVPESVLAARDAGPIRLALGERAGIVGLWVAVEEVFDAGVRVCAPVLEVGGDGRRPIRLTRGSDFTPLPAATPDGARPSWSHLALAAHGVPEVHLHHSAGTLGDIASATAGFRDQFYGLAPYVVEAPADHDGPGLAPLVTVGLLGAGACRWGDRATRFAGQRWHRPAVDLVALRAGDPTLARWVGARLVPKVVVATQTRVVEAAPDPLGEWVPSVPVISVEPADAHADASADPDRVSLVAAVLLAPPVTSWALAEAGGTALAAGRVKLAARQVRRIPLPVDRAAWAEAAGVVAARDWSRFGSLMLAAYDVPHHHPVLEWWLSRIG